MDKSEVKENENAGTSYDMASRVIKRISQMFQSFAGHLTPFKEQQPPPLCHRGSKTREQLMEKLI